MNAGPNDSRQRAATPWGAWFGLLLAAVVIAFAYTVWHNQRQDHAAIADLTRQIAALQQAQTAAMQAQAASSAAERKLLGDRLDGLDASLNNLKRQSVQGRDTWIKAEAASLLMAAIEEVQLRADPALAIRALQQADARLKLLSDPRLIAVRQEIAREISSLAQVPQPDVDGMAIKLASLAAGVDQLPLKRNVPQHYSADNDHTPRLDEGKLGFWDRLKGSLTRLLSDVFTVHRSNVPVGPLLAPREEFFLRRNLELRLYAARGALLNRDGPGFKDSVRAAELWLSDYFDLQSSVVKTGVQQLAGMEQQNIDPPLPDISASLGLLRQLEPGRAGAP